MCNTHRPAYARSPRQSDPGHLIAPHVSVADPIDGLIKTIDLQTDIVVTFPIWPTPPLPNDRYQLFLNGKPVGEQGIFPDPVPEPDTELTLSIPVSDELKEDGTYTLTYGAIPFPGGTIKFSQPLTLVVDRTAPGSHQLGYMDFPSEATDGLTAAELSEMGDVLTGKIFGYTGLSKDDVIQTYWGAAPGPQVFLDGNEDGTQPILVNFSKDFLLAQGNVAVPTYYTVTDRAGNTSEPSRNVTIPLFLTEITRDLPAPIIENYDGMIDYDDAMARVEVQIPTSQIIEEGDHITLHWGSVAVGPFPVDPDDIGEPVILIVDVDFTVIEQAQNGNITLSYDVIRSGNIVGTSETLNITVNVELPVPGVMDKPTVRGASSVPSAEDNVIDENDFELDATVIINWNSGFNALETITVFWGGQEVLEQPYTITNTDVAGGRPLLLVAKNAKFKPVGTGNDIRVYYTVTSDTNPNTSTSLEQGIIVRSKDELPGGPNGADAPEFTALNEHGAIIPALAIFGAPVFIKPYVNIAAGQVITFTYDAYDKFVGGDIKLTWTHISQPLTEEQVADGYHFRVDREMLLEHCNGHTESYFQIKSDTGQGNSKRANVLVDMRTGDDCNQ